MELYLTAALKQVGEPFSFDETEALAPLAYGGRTIELEAPVHVAGTFVFDGAAVTLDAEADTVLHSVCGFCNTVFSEPFTFPIRERFVKAQLMAPEDEESYPFTGERLDLTKALTDNLLLHMPLTCICSPDCKGLCPICGVNRNLTACNCQPMQKPGPFSALAELSDEE